MPTSVGFFISPAIRPSLAPTWLLSLFAGRSGWARAQPRERKKPQMNLLNIAVQQTAVLHLRDAADQPLYEQKPDPENAERTVDDLDKPVTITLNGPGSKAYAKANAARQNKALDALRRKGKADQSAEQMLADNVDFYTACTAATFNIEIDGLQGEALYRAMYSNAGLGFIIDQVAKYMGDWANFTKGSTKT